MRQFAKDQVISLHVRSRPRFGYRAQTFAADFAEKARCRFNCPSKKMAMIYSR
jgi:hypothetical protein